MGYIRAVLYNTPHGKHKVGRRGHWKNEGIIPVFNWAILAYYDVSANSTALQYWNTTDTSSLLPLWWPSHHIQLWWRISTWSYSSPATPPWREYMADAVMLMQTERWKYNLGLSNRCHIMRNIVLIPVMVLLLCVWPDCIHSEIFLSSFCPRPPRFNPRSPLL